MSLRVWLPLNGDLRNLGASSVKVVNNGATIDNAGKIGKCYSFDGSDDYISLTDSLLYNIFKGGTTPFSIAMWVYHNDSTRAILFGDYGLTGAINFNIELTTSHTIRFYWAGSPDYNTTINVGNQVWTHIILVYDGTKLLSYKNGILTNTRNGILEGKNKVSGSFYLGRDSRTGATTLNGKINDFRIYDHALSAAEVAEIARGLVLHYKLNQNFGLTDIIQNQDTYAVYNNFSGSGTTGTLTNLNETYQGHVVRRETMTPNDTSLTSFKTTLHSHGVYGHRQTFLANTKYVFWIYFRPISHMDMRVGGTASNINGWIEIPPKEIGNGWYKVGQYRNGTVTSDKTDSIFTSFYTPTAASGVPIIIDWAAPHLLAGTTEIPDSDWFGDTEVIDSSGYGHNGTITGTLTTSSNSPRYDNCIHMSATNQKILINNIITSGFGNSYTFAWWGKCATFSGTMHWGFSDGVRLNGIFNGNLWNTGDSGQNPLYKPGTTIQVTAPSTEVWHHFAMTGDGTKCKVYLDGEYWGIAKTYKSISGTSIYLNGWNSSTSYSNSDLSLSDFRMYCTPLLDTDIKSLYNLGMKIDNLSTLHTYELEETNTDKLIKTGVLKSQGLYENGYANILHYDKNIYIEPDGSTWVHICHHNNPANGVFASNGSWATGYYIDANRWYDVEQILSNLIEYEFMVKQKTTSSAAETKYRWIQSINPMNATWADVKPGTITYITTSGYTNGNMGGMYYRNDKTYQRMCIANGSNGNWFGGIGVWTAYQGGIPGYPNTTVTSGYVDLYARVYVPTKLIKDKGFSSIQFIEA